MQRSELNEIAARHPGDEDVRLLIAEVRRLQISNEILREARQRIGRQNMTYRAEAFKRRMGR